MATLNFLWPLTDLPMRLKRVKLVQINIPMNPHNPAAAQSTQRSGEKRMPTGTVTNPVLAQQLLDAFDQLQGVHPGFRPAHAKGLMCSGTFTPTAEAAKLTRAPHANRPSTPVTVRYSDSTGVPNIPDNDPQSSPKG